MRFMKRKRFQIDDEFGGDDPMAGIANLFDLGLVFIVGLLMTLFSVYRLEDLFSERSELTIIKKTEAEGLHIITKKGTRIKAMKVTESKAKGGGERLGTAYRLEDGTIVYVPD